MKKLFFCFSLLLLTLLSYAQLQVSIAGGIHKSTITPAFLGYPDTSISKGEISTTGAYFGFTAEIPINGKLYFRPGVIYSAKGSEQNQIFDTANLVANTKKLKREDKKRIKSYSLNTKLHLAYIEMPLNLMFKSNLGTKTKIFVSAGPQLSLFYNGYVELNKVSVSQDSASDVLTYFTNQKNTDLPVGRMSGRYRTLHFGANALAGLDFGRIYFTINYSKDLTGFYEDDSRSFKASTLGGCIGVYLGQREKGSNSTNKKISKP
jgi:hypothetical protein